MPEKYLIGLGMHRLKNNSLLSTIETPSGYDLAARLWKDNLQGVLRSDTCDVGV